MHIVLEESSGAPADIVVYKHEGDKKNVAFWKIVVVPPNDAVVYYVWTKPKEKGKGYGSRVLEDLKGTFDCIRTEWNASTPESREWFQRRGFVRKGDKLVWKRTSNGSIASPKQ